MNVSGMDLQIQQMPHGIRYYVALAPFHFFFRRLSPVPPQPMSF
jgi:hypothetical protein